MDPNQAVSPRMLMILAVQSAALEADPWPTQALAESLSARMAPGELCCEVLEPAAYALGRSGNRGSNSSAHALALLRLNALILLQQKRAQEIAGAVGDGLH